MTVNDLDEVLKRFYENKKFYHTIEVLQILNLPIKDTKIKDGQIIIDKLDKDGFLINEITGVVGGGSKDIAYHLKDAFFMKMVYMLKRKDVMIIMQKKLDSI